MNITSAFYRRLLTEYLNSNKAKVKFFHDEYERWPEFSEQALEELVMLGKITYNNYVYPSIELNIDDILQQ